MRTTCLTLLLTLPSLPVAAGQYTPAQVRAAVQQAGGLDGFLRVIASNTAKMSGQMFDAETQITGAAATEKTLVYYLRLVNHSKSDIPSVDALRRNVAAMLAPSVCTAPVASILINEYGAAYKYMAYSKSREYLFEYTLNKATCSPNHRW